jgi:hypothetical protein
MRVGAPLIRETNHDALQKFFRDDKDRNLFQQVKGVLSHFRPAAHLMNNTSYLQNPASQYFHTSFVEFRASRGRQSIPYLKTAHESTAERCLRFLNDSLSSCCPKIFISEISCCATVIGGMLDPPFSRGFILTVSHNQLVCIVTKIFKRTQTVQDGELHNFGEFAELNGINNRLTA